MERTSIKVLVSDPTVLGNGFLKKLEADGCEVLALAANETADLQNPFESRALESDVIFHTAEKSPYDDQGQFLENRYDFNLEITRKLCAAIDQWKVRPKAFFYVSSVCVYGAQEGVLVNENHPLNGTSVYAKSKIETEDFLIEWAYEKQIILSILRLPIFIASEPPHGLFKSMISTIKARRYISISAGKAQKSLVWAEDLASLVGKGPYVEGRYNLTDGKGSSIQELEEAIWENLGMRKFRRIPIFFIKPIALLGDVLGRKKSFNSEKLKERTASLTFDNRKAVETFGWTPTDVLAKLVESKI